MRRTFAARRTEYPSHRHINCRRFLASRATTRGPAGAEWRRVAAWQRRQRAEARTALPRPTRPATCVVERWLAVSCPPWARWAVVWRAAYRPHVQPAQPARGGEFRRRHAPPRAATVRGATWPTWRGRLARMANWQRRSAPDGADGPLRSYVRKSWPVRAERRPCPGPRGPSLRPSHRPLPSTSGST